jgi:uncharacterized protein YjbJ (UPF0337 family)
MIKNIIIGALIVVILGGGAWYYLTQVDHTPIEKILKNPRAYEGKAITIAGEVTDRTSLVIVKFFKLKDKTGEITVITKRSLPAVGAKERVKGKVQEAFAIGDQQMLVFVEESEEKDKKQ